MKFQATERRKLQILWYLHEIKLIQARKYEAVFLSMTQLYFRSLFVSIASLIFVRIGLYSHLYGKQWHNFYDIIRENVWNDAKINQKDLRHVHEEIMRKRNKWIREKNMYGLWSPKHVRISDLRWTCVENLHRLWTCLSNISMKDRCFRFEVDGTSVRAISNIRRIQLEMGIADFSFRLPSRNIGSALTLGTSNFADTSAKPRLR